LFGSADSAGGRMENMCFYGLVDKFGLVDKYLLKFEKKENVRREKCV